MQVLGDRKSMLPLVMKTREKHVEWSRRAIEVRYVYGINGSESLQVVEPHGFLQSRFYCQCMCLKAIDQCVCLCVFVSKSGLIHLYVCVYVDNDNTAVHAILLLYCIATNILGGTIDINRQILRYMNKSMYFEAVIGQIFHTEMARRVPCHKRESL